MKKQNIVYAVIVLLVVVAVLYYVYGRSNNNIYLNNQQVTAVQLEQLREIALNNTLANNIGIGAATDAGKQVTGPYYTVNKTPAVLYIGGDFCPFCAVTRWGLVIALMRFGNFTGLEYMTSSPSDVYPNTATFTFSNATYTSAVLAFNGIEVQNRTGAPLQHLTPLQTKIATKYGTGSTPFLDFFNMTTVSGAVVTPAVINRYNWVQIISMLNDQNSIVAQSVIGNANLFTAYICKGAPNINPNVCNQPYVKNMRIRLV